ncbi:NADPH-dependent F420 reductase [Variovorax paradoxus]|jgi:predicted dinucleotide-binding enzyme|uniref:NADPH-dependent F420 reductase n=1 Tax=Variovorax paradoxus TaxID=34073 RepID=UPI00102C11DD|nr:NAD(P)-binding domain-containing protein [Variovorax paradoxus]
MNNISILGSGRVASALARKLVASGHDITIGSRDPFASAAKWTGPAVRHMDPRAATAGAQIVLNATPGDSALARLGELRAELEGKILIDISNASARGADGMPAGLLYTDGSLGERLQQALPGTRVVKTLNTMLFSVMVDPRSLSVPASVFVSGNDESAKTTVTVLLGDLGWPVDWIVDLGDITSARATEALMLMVPHVLRRYGFKPFALSLAR